MTCSGWPLSLVLATLCTAALVLPSAAQTYQSIDAGDFKQMQVHPNAPPSLFVYTTASSEGIRWVKVSAHTQAQPVVVKLSTYVPLEHAGGLAKANYGVDVGITTRLGNYTNMLSPGCYSPSSTWVPHSNEEKVYFSVELADASSISAPVQIGIYVDAGTKDRPIPGGCATTGLVPSDPTVRLDYDDATATITFQQSDLGQPRSAGRGQGVCSCDFVAAGANTGSGTLKYHVYRAFIADCGSDFHRPRHEGELMNGLKRMASVKGVLKYGTRTHTDVLPNMPLEASFDSVQGQGVIYSVVVEDSYQATIDPDNKEQYYSVLTSTHTYACSITAEEDKPSCSGLFDPVYMTVVILAAVAGLLLCLLAQRYFRMSLFLHMLLFSACVVYILFANFTSMDYGARIGASIPIGLVAGILFVLLWMRTDCTGIALILVGTNMGALVAGFIFATPLGDVDMFVNDMNFWFTFVAFALLVPVIFLLKGRVLNIVASSVVGSYCVLFMVDYFVGSDFDRFFRNSIKRATISTFAKSYTGDYFSTDFNGCANLDMNIGFLAAWVVVSGICIVLQYCLFARGVAVPVGPWSQRGRRLNRSRQHMKAMERYASRSDRGLYDGGPRESDPLLGAPKPPPRRSEGYGRSANNTSRGAPSQSDMVQAAMFDDDIPQPPPRDRRRGVSGSSRRTGAPPAAVAARHVQGNAASAWSNQSQVSPPSQRRAKTPSYPI